MGKSASGGDMPKESLDPETKIRDKTAKEPQTNTQKVPIKPKPKIKKAFVPTKKSFTTDKPMEHRVRNIRMTSLESAKMIWETLIDYQNDLAQQEMDDPDKSFHDWEKMEKFFKIITTIFIPPKLILSRRSKIRTVEKRNLEDDGQMISELNKTTLSDVKSK